jgi:hypothetical protein
MNSGTAAGSHNLGSHIPPEPRTTRFLTRAVGRLTTLFLNVAARARFLSGIDFQTIATNNTEKILSLPGALPFFPNSCTDVTKVKDLMTRLHPVKTAQRLIRLGPKGDGGYLVPDDFVGIEACFSPGVNNVAGFERDCAEMGMKVFMADASVEAPPEMHPQFTFIKKFIGSIARGDFITLEQWVNATLPNSHSDLLLQIDIEGYEYETFLSTPESLLQRFRMIVVEFHNLDFLFCQPLFELYSRAFEKLLQHHTCVHIHPNNLARSIKVQGLEIPQMAEFTFLRNDRLAQAGYAHEFPHPLDHDNSDRAPLRLPESCFRSKP